MPERFNCAVLVEVADDRDVRWAIMERITSIFSPWLSRPVQIALIDGSAGGEVLHWKGGQDGFHLRHDVGKSILVIYFESVDRTCISLVSISKHSSAHTYTVSLPGRVIQHADLCPLLAELCLQLSGTGVRTIVVAGAELDIEEEVNSANEVIRATSQLGSLVEYLGCDEGDAVGLANFVQVYRAEAVVVLKRC